MQKTVLDLALVLPTIPDERDACVARLRAMLEAKGLSLTHVVHPEGKAQLCVHFDTSRISLQRVRELVRAAGVEISGQFRHENLRIDGMDCATCALVIEHALRRLPGVLEASVSYAAERLRLEYDSQQVTFADIRKRIEALGYGLLEEHRQRSWFARNCELLFSLAAGALLLAGWINGALGGPAFASLVLYLGAYCFGGSFTLRDAWQALRERRFDIDTLMIVAAIGAALLGAWGEGALLLFLFSLGHALEHRAMARARNAIEALGAVAPKTALVRRDGAEQEVPVEALLRGDQVIVKPGQRIPADGRIVSGHSAINQASVTGESVPVDKSIGATVFAGTVNGEGGLTIEVTKLARESTLARMVDLVAAAQTDKSPTQQFTDRFEQVFVPLVLAGAGLLIALPPLLGYSFQESFYRAMAVLVAASPCALAIATPAAVLSAVARAARDGILIKGGAALENLGHLSVIAFDKTGTITRGQPELTDVLPLQGTEAELLTLAAAVECRSAHPLAQAVVNAAKARNISWPQATDIEAVTGKGIRATVAGQRVAIGNLSLFAGQAVPVEIQQAATQLGQAGKTLMLVRRENTYLGVLGLADVPREGVREIIDCLRRIGIKRLVMLTGDNEQVGRAIGWAVGMDAVKAGLLPEDKLRMIDELAAHDGTVAMVGDGVNDAPAMARSTVGIAMGGAGTDVALETADVALMADDLAKLPLAVSLSRASRRIIQQNLWVALGMVAVLIPATLLGWARIGEAVLLHEGSTLIVVFNALRLLAFRARAPCDAPQAATAPHTG